MQFDTVIDKTEKGFGIFFAKVSAPDGSNDRHVLVVDGFVETADSYLVTGGQATTNKATAVLQLGDVLIKVNGEDCIGKEVADILNLLRTANVGSNTLSFSRNVPTTTILDDETMPSNDLTASVTETPKSRLMGALLKVKSKIRAEIDGGGEELLREQLEDELFEKQWLEEFEMLKDRYEAKWETCTYTADEFCGLLYRSSDSHQKEHLLQEYPTLMESWKDDRVSTSSRVIPDWPAAKLTYVSAVNYDGIDCSAPPSSSSGVNPRSIHCSQSLQTALECLRVEFMWRSADLREFSRRLDAAGISSCSELLEALGVRSGYFERNFQSKEYPRLSKTMLRALRASTQKANLSKNTNWCHEKHLQLSFH